MISFLKKYLFIVIFTTAGYSSNSPKLVDVLNETITVNSKTAFRGNTRILINARIPAGATGYIYRFTIAKKSNLAVPNALFTLLKNLNNQYLTVAASLAELAINNGENNSVDAFIFNCTADASNFAISKDGNWSGCQEMMSVNNSCRFVDACIGQDIYLGFRNNNIIQGVDIRVEVVAIMGNSSKKFYRSTFAIFNNTQMDLPYELSFDGKKWMTTAPLSRMQREFYTFDQHYIYMRIITSKKVIRYLTLYPYNRYYIFWDDENKLLSIARY